MLAAWEAIYGGQNASIAVGPAGDWDKNLAVNGRDFLLWQRSMHQSISSAPQASAAPTADLAVVADAAVADELVDMPALAQAATAFSRDFARKESQRGANDTDIAFASAIGSTDNGNSLIDFTSRPRDMHFEDGACSLPDRLHNIHSPGRWMVFTQPYRPSSGFHLPAQGSRCCGLLKSCSTAAMRG